MTGSSTCCRPAAGALLLLRPRLRMLLLACGLLVSPSGGAQSPEQLQRLIFEPAPLPPAGLDSSASGTATAAAETAGPIADPGSEASLDTDIARYRAAIAAMGNEESPYSHSLREQYAALGLLQQRAGDHAGAILSLESAMHIDRVNEGLFTVNQIQLVKSIIASHTALGNYREVEDFQEYLYYIQLKSFATDDPRLLAAKETWADWNVEAYLKLGTAPLGSAGLNMSTGAGSSSDYVAIQNPVNGTWNYVPRNQMINVLNPNGMATNAALTSLYASSMPYAVSPEQMIDPRLRKARDLYEELRSARGDAGTTNDAYGAEHKLANIDYAVKLQFDRLEAVTDTGSLNFNRVMQPRTTAPVVTRGYTKSRDNLEAIAERLAQNPASTAVERAQAWIYLGDWHITFGRTQRAEDAYAKAWAVLQEAGTDAATVAAMFAPAPVTAVPAFAIHQYSRTLYGLTPDAALDYRGYIDVTLGIDRNGGVRSPRIDAVSEDTSQQVRSMLLDFLRDTRVRPAVVDGKLVAQEEVKVRYHYTY